MGSLYIHKVSNFKFLSTHKVLVAVSEILTEFILHAMKKATMMKIKGRIKNGM